MFLLALFACSDTPMEAPAAEPAPAATKQVDAAPAERPDGAALFAAHCASCHGPGGKGDGPAAAALDPKPADLVGPRADHLRGIPRRQIIADGLPGTAMAAWKDVLSEDDLMRVTHFVHELKHGPGSTCGDGTCGEGHGRGRGKRGR